MEKYEFSQREVKFLGDFISDRGIKADPNKNTAVTEMREPNNVSELRSFLGRVNQES